MRKVIVFALMIIFTVPSVGQDRKQSLVIKFDSDEWDLGTVNEVDGEVYHTFEFTNVSDRTIAIERVSTSCGCTSTEYPRTPIRAGVTSKFTVAFDPDGIRGRFNKKVNISCDGGKSRTTLTVKGTVNPKPRTVADDFPFVLGEGVRANVAYRNFGHIGQGKTKTMTIELINTNDQDVKIDTLWGVRSGMLIFDFQSILKAGKKTLISMTYDLESKPRYGMFADQIRLVVDGEESKIPLSANATGVDDFKSKKDSKAPILKVSPGFHSFGSVKRGDVLKLPIIIKNEGKEELVIRSVDVRANTDFSASEGTVTQPNEEIETTLTLTIGEEDFDTVFGGVIIIANDPNRPMREIRVSAKVEY